MATYWLPSSTGYYDTSKDAVKYRIKIVEGTFNSSARTMPITVQAYFYRTNTGYTTDYTHTLKYTVNGTAKTFSNAYQTYPITNSGVYMNAYTVNVPVNADGSVSVSVYCQYTSTNSSNLTTSNNGGTITLTKQAAKTYTVSYNANGGTGAPSSQTKYHGTTLTLSGTKPTRTGYTFKGWATTSTGSVAYSAGGSYTSNAGATLYAVWGVNTYTITYNANGGTGAPAATSYTYATGGTINLSSTIPIRTGYTFLGWSTSSTATSATYSAGQAWNKSNASNYTLYAVWGINTYTISFNGNGGSGAPAAQTKTYNTTLTLSGTVPTRTGYTFKNWNTAANGTGTSYNAGASYTANSGVTLYAQWTAITYTVSYNANGGNNAPATQTKTYGVTLSLSTTIPTREGYQFLGWGMSSDATTATYGAGGNYTSNSSVTLYAVWVQVQTATVQQIMARYQLPNGDFTEYSQVYAASLEEGDTCSWSFDETTEYEAVSVSYTVGKEAMTKYVDVLRKKYSIKYDANGGLCAPKTQNFYYGCDLHLTMRRPTRSGYDFLGWAYSPTATEVKYKKGDSFDSTITANPTLYAIWAKAYSENIYFYDDGRCEACEFIEDDYLALGGGIVTTGLTEMYVSGVDVEEVSSLVDEALNLVGGDE